MRRIVFPLLLLLALLLYAGYRGLVLPPADATLANGARLDWVPCWFEVPLTRVTHCAYFYPAESDAASTQRLPVVVFRHLGLQHRESPIMYLAGGPGGSAWLGADEIESWYYWLDSVDWPHDFVVFDQRGTGLSEPRFACPEATELNARLLSDPLPTAQGMAQGYATYRRCHKRLRGADIDLSRYTTVASAGDIRDLMNALGHDAWNLYGVSYGTRLAMEVQRRYPERVRSVILDSVYPPEIDGAMTWPWLLHRSLERLFEACRNDAACHAEHPRLKAQFVDLLDRLAEEPLRYAMPHPVSGKMMDVTVNDERLVYVIFDALYQWDLIGQLPATIDGLHRGDKTLLRPLLAMHVGSLFDPTFSDAVYFSVECHDAHPFDRQRYLQNVEAHPLVAAYTRPAADYDVCEFWSSGRAPERFYRPVHSKLPTLLLAGEMDPITPVEWAEQAARGYPNGYLFRFPGIGHSVIDSDQCGVRIARQFLAHPWKKPSAACVADLPPVQFSP